MLFTVITLLRQKYPDKEIVVFLGTNPQKIRKLMFIAEKITLKEKLFCLFGFHKNKHHEQLKNLFLNTDLILDISGFALSSQFRWQHNISLYIKHNSCKKI
jgi:colanic acid/amylovoran biosynthesis protein